jgi:hypothetical protein
MKTWIAILKKWLPLAIVTVGTCGLVYLAAQQMLRTGANDPQIQLAEDTARALDSGAAAETLVPAQKVELTASLAPFLMIFDGTGNVVASSAALRGANPALPAGVLEYVRQNGEDRVTWQPESGVRLAAVIVKAQNGFVLAGRSLRETEKREGQMELLSFAALLGIWAVTLVVIALGEWTGNKPAA